MSQQPNIRPAHPGDEAKIQTLLETSPETTMFMRAGLAQFGLSGSEHPHAARFWVEETDTELTGAFSHSNAGFVHAHGQGPRFWQGFYDAMLGQAVAGLTGEADIVEGMRATLALEQAEYDLDRIDPLYRLALDQPDDPLRRFGPADIRKPTEADAALLSQWFRAYHIEALSSPDNAALTRAIADRVATTIAAGNVRLLIEAGQPVAMTAFNAQLPDMVQIGGVYTPPHLRNQGLARRVVAAHLQEAQALGTKTAILFASSPAARRAYEAIGFEQIGRYTLAILSAPVTIPVTGPSCPPAPTETPQ